MAATTSQSLSELALLHQSYVRGLENLATQAQTENENLVVKRPWIDEPAGSVPFDEQDGIALPIVGVTATVLSFTVPTGFDGVIKFLSNNVNFGGFDQFSGDIIWRLLINKRPVRNFNNVRAEKGTIFQGREISPIRLYSKNLVEWEVEHVANGALAGQTICSFTGYVYPSKGDS